MKNTFENLVKAFIGESQARNRYTFYAKIAKKEENVWWGMPRMRIRPFWQGTVRKISFIQPSEKIFPAQM